MNFVSVEFFLFFLAVLLSQLLLKKSRQRHAALLLASYVFYGWWDWRFCFLMLGLSAVAYLSALGLEKRRSRALLAVGVTVPLAALAFFKYTNFFLDSFCAAFGVARMGALNIILPVGISFYTFQSLSYTIDVYRGRVAVSRDPLKFALYISFFPQLVAGPIVKAADFLPQLGEERRPSRSRIASGTGLFLWGMVKKAVLADQLSLFVDAVFAAPAAYASGTVLLAVLSYALQIYFDFAGYSDMAIGCARMLGYDLQINFDLPYIARNPTEFWRRWHISLSTWLKEYLYISLGGNRRGLARTCINLMLTMLLGGLWHGAGVNFILWGGLHGLALCAHKLWSRRFSRRRGGAFRLGATLLTFAFTCLGWVFFRAQTPGAALAVLEKLFVWSDGVVHVYSWSLAALALMLLATLWCVCFRRDGQGVVHGAQPEFDFNSFTGCLAFFLLAGFVLIMMYTGENPFIYFQF